MTMKRTLRKLRADMVKADVLSVGAELDKILSKSGVDAENFWKNAASAVFENGQIPITDLYGNPVKLNNSYVINGKEYTITENSLRNEHNMPIRMNYLRKRYDYFLKAYEILKANEKLPSKDELLYKGKNE